MNQFEVNKMNRKAWIDAMDSLLPKKAIDRLLDKFRQPDASSLQQIKKDKLLKHGIKGKSVFQPCCHNGKELVSMKNLGASRCVGFDFCPSFIAVAKEIAIAAGQECEFVETDVYHIDSQYADQFDIAYISVGTLMWLPDLGSFFSVVSELMRGGAWMFLIEQHPLLDMYGLEPSRKKRFHRFKESYFRHEPYKVVYGLNYQYLKSNDSKTPCFRYHHKVSDIIQGCVESGLVVESFEELDTAVGGGAPKKLEKRNVHFPLTFILTAKKRE